MDGADELSQLLVDFRLDVRLRGSILIGFFLVTIIFVQGNRWWVVIIVIILE